MRRIYNTMKYGSAYTRRMLLLCLISGIMTLGFVVFAVILSKMLLFFGALIGVFVTLAFAQTLHMSEKAADDNIDMQHADEKTVEKVVEKDIEAYDRAAIKKVLKKYKVKNEHKMVLIDFCEKLKLYQTPAYIWVEGGKLHILAIEKQTRHIEIPLSHLQSVTYLKKQQCNPDIDYAIFKGNSIMAGIFRPYLPDYTRSTVVDDVTAYKNLYGIGPDIYFTNRSAANLFDLLGLPFDVDDNITNSNRVNIFFKNIYKASILYKDNVIDSAGYADRVSNILDEMAHSDISRAGFKDTLQLMIKNKLITREFAMYYMEVRDKISG